MNCSNSDNMEWAKNYTSGEICKILQEAHTYLNQTTYLPNSRTHRSPRLLRRNLLCCANCTDDQAPGNQGVVGELHSATPVLAYELTSSRLVRYLERIRLHRGVLQCPIHIP